MVGGRYGVAMGSVFFGESMFSSVRDASKVALAWLVARMRVGHFTLLDCQLMTPHLATMGAIAISGADYASLLAGAVEGAVGAGAGAGSGAGAAWRDGLPPPEFRALDDLLEAETAGAGSPSGKFISQLLTQTS